MTRKIDTFTPSEIESAAGRIVSAANCCYAETLEEAVAKIRYLANDEYYDEGEFLHKIADFIESKLK